MGVTGMPPPHVRNWDCHPHARDVLVGLYQSGFMGGKELHATCLDKLANMHEDHVLAALNDLQVTTVGISSSNDMALE